ncbi:hypothetical protein P2318_17175 [Myxococcaceae bacterium GXIMD 01537]
MNGLDVVSILQVGLSGLGFLLAFLAYRLLASEQKTAKPRLEVLRAARNFLLLCIVLVVIVGGFQVSGHLMKPDPAVVSGCRRSLDKLKVEVREAETVEQLRTAVGEEVQACSQMVSSLRESE